jgi:hypothetical protein
MIVLLQVLLGGQLLLPGPLKRPGDESLLGFNGVILASRSPDFVSRSFSPRLSEPVQLCALLLQPLGGGQ